jgi:hypothetical protein
LCERNLTPSALTLTVNVVPNGCATVEAENAPGTPALDLTLCTPGECRTLRANVTDVPSTTTYTVSSIPFCPQAAFENPTWNNILPGGPIGDDDWAAPFSLPAGMNFCFYGENYTQLNVGTNQVIRFPTPPARTDLFAAGDYCEWSYNTTIPNAAFPIKNAIFGVYQDTDFSVTPPVGTQISVNYQVVGTYPCRKFIANFSNCPQFSCGIGIGLSTSQIVLYEVSNIIEVYVQRRVFCGWNGGRGTVGVINVLGNQAVAAPGRNAAAFSTDPTPNNPNNADNVSEAWRFTPTGPNIPVTVNWYEGPAVPANFIGTGPTVTVCPSVTTTYTLETIYNVCGIPQTATSTTTLNVKSDLTGTPLDITECTNVFDITSNTGIILGALSPSEYDITYHTSLADANLGNNPIPLASLTAYSPGVAVGSYPIYASIFLNSFNCRVIKPFNLIIDNCSIRIGALSDLTVCENPANLGTGVFDLTQQIVPALDGQVATDYTITFHSLMQQQELQLSPVH